MKKVLIKCLAITVVLGALSSIAPGGTAWAQSCCLILPPYPANTSDVSVIDYYPNSTKATNLFLFTLSNSVPGIPAGTYGGWCVDAQTLITVNQKTGTNYPVAFYSTCDPSELANIPDHSLASSNPPVGPPPIVSLETWNEVNYIINHRTNDFYWDVQVAINLLVGGPPPGPSPPYPTVDTNIVAALTNSAIQNAAGWVPVCGDKIGVIVVAQPQPLQILLMEVPCPGTVTIQCPTNQVLGCNPQTIPSCDDLLSQVVATNTCNQPVTVTCAQSGVIAVGCQNSIIYNYTATDAVGSTGTCSEEITWTVSTNNPTITQFPSNVTICAGTAVPPANTALVTATDNCTASPVVSVLPDVPSGTCPTIITRTYVVTDGCNNQTTSNQTITINCAPTCSVTPPSAAICAGGSQTFTVNPSSGTAPYTYLWSNGATTSNITVSAANTYTVTVTDANGCTTTCGATLTVNPAPSCSVTPPSAAICAGGSQTFTVNPSSGTAPYTYLWSNGATTSNITVSAANTYTVTVKDSNGCTTTCGATLTINPAPSCSVTPPSAAICAGGSQTFTVNPSSGTAPYTYLWSNGATTSNITVSAANTYTVTVKDSNGCTTTCGATLTVNPAPSCSVTPPSAAICAGGSQTFTVNASSGTAPYTYLWSNGATTSNITVSAANTYTVTVKDSNGCTTTCGATLTINPAPSCSVTPPSAAICAGGSQTFTVNASSGTAPYTYLWSNGATTSNITVSAANTYTVTVKDSNGCTTTCGATLTVNPAPSCSVTPPSAAVCAGGSQTFTVNPSGGTAPYTYLWSNGATTSNITVSAANTYTVTVKDSNGCTTTCGATLTVNPAPSCSVTPPSAAICAGGSQTFTVNPSSGTAPYTYLWSNGATTSNITVSAANTYTVTVKDSNGCTTTCGATLTVNPAPSCSVTPPSAAICAGGSQTFTVNPSSGTAPYTYLWSNGATTSNITVSAANTYTVTVKDSNGCTTTCGATLTVNPAPTCSVTPPSAEICAGSQTFTVNPSSGTAPYTYLWSNGATTSNITVSAANTYTVTVKDSNGCTTTCGATLTVNPSAGVSCVKQVSSPDDQDVTNNPCHITLPGDGKNHNVTYSVQVMAGAQNLTGITITDPTLSNLGVQMPAPFSLAADTTTNLTLATLAFNCRSSCASNGNNSCANPICGNAQYCSVLLLGNNQVCNIYNNGCVINGNVSVGTNCTLQVSGNENCYGLINLGPGGTFQNTCSGSLGAVTQNADVSEAIGDAQSAASWCAAQPSTQSYTTLNGSTTITGGPGLNVIAVQNCNLNGKTVTLSGPSTAKFIINCTGNFAITNGGFNVAGGCTTNNVLYNIIGSGSTVTCYGSACNVNGTILCSQRSFNCTSCTVNGGVICGGNCNFGSGCHINCPPPVGPCPPGTNTVTVTANSSCGVVTSQCHAVIACAPPSGTQEGCCPSFWQNCTNAWNGGFGCLPSVCYRPTNCFNNVFGCTPAQSGVSSSTTLYQCIQSGSGLACHAATALLNSQCMNYPLLPQQVISQYCVAVGAQPCSSNCNTASSLLALFSEYNCGQGGQNCPFTGGNWNNGNWNNNGNNWTWGANWNSGNWNNNKNGNNWNWGGNGPGNYGW